MTIRTHTIKKKNPKHSQEWSWEETPELLAAIDQLHKKTVSAREQFLGTFSTEYLTYIFESNFAVETDAYYFLLI